MLMITLVSAPRMRRDSKELDRQRVVVRRLCRYVVCFVPWMLDLLALAPARAAKARRWRAFPNGMNYDGDLPSIRSRHGLVSAGDYLYVLGGHKPPSGSDRVQLVSSGGCPKELVAGDGLESSSSNATNLGMLSSFY